MNTPSTESSENPEKDDNNNPDHNECLKILNSVLDDEATDEERAYFKHHLENCMPYYEIYNLDLKIKELIQKKCCSKKVPGDLVKSIKEKILQQAD